MELRAFLSNAALKELYETAKSLACSFVIADISITSFCFAPLISYAFQTVNKKKENYFENNA
jgi:hypothetical protein